MPKTHAWAGPDPMSAPVTVILAQGAYSKDPLLGTLQEACKDARALVQALDPTSIFDAEHAQAAARRALRAHADARGTARDLGVEIALYAAGTTQIDDAFERVGLPEHGNQIVLVALGPDRDQTLQAILDAHDLDRAPLEGTNPEALEQLGLQDAADTVHEEDLSLLVRENVALTDAKP